MPKRKLTTDEESVEEFLKKNPNFKDFLRGYIEKEEEQIKKKLEEEKVELSENVKSNFKKHFDYDVENFKKQSLPGFKYQLELLEKSDRDFKLLKKSLNMNKNNSSLPLAKLKRPKLHLKGRNQNLKIYRVIPTDSTVTESSTSSSSKVLLLHGTKAPNVEGILKIGFKPSEKGRYGPGLYLIDSIDYAYNYGRSFAHVNGIYKKFGYFFVTEVNQADVQKPMKHFQTELSYQ